MNKVERIIFWIFIIAILVGTATTVLGDTYTLMTVPTCSGEISAKVYTDQPYNFLECRREGQLYKCPCAKNKKVILNATIKDSNKVVIEYFLTPGIDKRITKEMWVSQSDADELAIEYKIKMNRRYLVLVILIVLCLILLLVGGAFFLAKKWYINTMSEE